MKIGIVTHYYKSLNYGGNLQACALCKVLSNLGFDAEQIAIKRKDNKKFFRTIKYKILTKNVFRELMIAPNLSQRNKAILYFNQNLIPHSKTYLEKDLEKIIDKYDAFIVGSDQVWHPFACFDGYLLKFVPSNKIKISYAASFGTINLTEKYKETLKNALKDFDAISVREKDAVKILQELGYDNVVQALDPTLLLTKEEWLDLLVPYNEFGEYIFTYFLGDNKTQKELVKNYAKEKGLSIINLPHLNGKFRKSDLNFGDFDLYKVSPNELLSLICKAKIVFTDSFHVTLFSILFNKKFIVFQRDGLLNMSSRIFSLLEIFGMLEYFCNKDEDLKISYIEKMIEKEIKQNDIEFKKLKDFSLNFLRDSLIKKGKFI